MKNKTLAKTNGHLRSKSASRRRALGLASSTAIETGESIARLEQRVIRMQHVKHRIKLA